MIFFRQKAGLFLLTMVLSILYCKEKLNSDNLNYKEVLHTEKLKTNDKRVLIENQSFIVELEDFGQIRFASYIDEEKNRMADLSFVFELKGKEINRLPYALGDFGHQFLFYSVKAISFKDIDNDGKKDIIYILSYIPGNGNCAGCIFDFGGIYFARNKSFEIDLKVNEALNVSHYGNTPPTELTIEEILKRYDKFHFDKFTGQKESH